MRELRQIKRERNERIEQSRATQRREIRGFGSRHRELCAQDFLAPEALRYFEKSNKRSP